MATTVLSKDVDSNLIETTVEMHRKMPSFSPTPAVIPKTLVGEMLVKASEILTGINPTFRIYYASTVGFDFKNDYGYL